MSLAKFRQIYDKNGSGRFVVSEGIAPHSYIFPHRGLPTRYYDIEDNRFEIVIPKGTILSLVTDSNGDSRFVPANGTGSTQAWGDADVVDAETGATPSNVSGDEDTVTVPARTVPVGCAQYDLYREFDKGNSQGAGWITRALVEWPMVSVLNDNLVAGDLVRADHMGRPVKLSTADAADYPWLKVGKVIEVEKFATNFDDGLLSYMQLPSDPGALQKVYELTKSGPYKGKMGVRPNLDVPDVVGAFRVTLNV